MYIDIGQPTGACGPQSPAPPPPKKKLTFCLNMT